MKINKCYANNEIVSDIYLNGSKILTANTDMGTPVYQVGLLSDLHIDSDNSQNDLTNALRFFTEQGVKMACVSGDITDHCYADEFETYKTIRDASTVPVYECTGNHDAYPASLERAYTVSLAEETCIAYHIHDVIGKDLCYCLHGNTYEGLQMTYNADGTYATAIRTKETGLNLPENDVYIFVGILGEGSLVFFKEELTWFRDTLERFRNQRCFIYEHCRAERIVTDAETGDKSDLFADKVSGNIAGAYLKSMWRTWGEKSGLVFESLVAHYTNCLWFHGHTHMDALMADDFGTRNANIDKYFGDAYDSEDLSASKHNSKFSWSVHVCSCHVPREVVDGTVTNNSNGSQGCLMSVYDNCVEIKYLDFADNNRMLKRYVLDTTLDTIEENTYVDKLNYFSE